jgi:hypothetical protein
VVTLLEIIHRDGYILRESNDFLDPGAPEYVLAFEHGSDQQPANKEHDGYLNESKTLCVPHINHSLLFGSLVKTQMKDFDELLVESGTASEDAS